MSHGQLFYALTVDYGSINNKMKEKRIMDGLNIVAPCISYRLALEKENTFEVMTVVLRRLAEKNDIHILWCFHVRYENIVSSMP